MLKEHELRRVAQVLDPLRLFHHLQDLQRTLLDATTSVSPDAQETSSVAVLSFCIERCIAGSGPLAPSTGEGAGPEQGIQATIPDAVSSRHLKQEANRHALSPRRGACASPVAPSQQPGEERLFPSQPIVGEKETRCPPTTTNGAAAQSRSVLSDGHIQMSHASAGHQQSRRTSSDRPIAQAIQDYLEDQRSHHRRPKTLEWHEQALGLFQRYLLTERQCVLLGQITEVQVRGWFAALPQMPTTTGALRSPSTVESYARSARAFCQWLVRHRYLQVTPFAQ